MKMGIQKYCENCQKYIKDIMNGEKGKDTNINRYECSFCHLTYCKTCFDLGIACIRCGHRLQKST